MAKKKKPDTPTPEATPNLPELNSALIYALIYGDKERDKDLYLSAIDTLLSSDRTSAKISELYQNLLSGDNTISVAANKSLDQLFSRTVRQIKNDAKIEEANKKLEEVKEQVKASEVEKKVARAKRVKTPPAAAKEPEPVQEITPPKPRKPRTPKSAEQIAVSAPKKPRAKKAKSVGEIGDGSIISAIEETTPELPNTVDIGESITATVTPTVEEPIGTTAGVGDSMISEVTNAVLSKEEIAKNMGLEPKGGNVYGPIGRKVATHKFQNGQFVPFRKPAQSPTPGSTVVPPTPSSGGGTVAPSTTITAKDKRKGRGRTPKPQVTPTGGTVVPPPPPSSGGGATPPPTPPPVGGTATPPPPPPPGRGGAPSISNASVLGGLGNLFRLILPLGKRMLRKVFKRKPRVLGPKIPKKLRVKNIARTIPVINNILGLLNMGQKKLRSILKDTADALNKIASAFEKFVNDIRKIQLKFGINAGTALNIKVGSITESISSYINSLVSGFTKAPVSAEKIRDTMASFQEEFGGVLETESAGRIAERGVRLGLTPEMQAKARRTFITTTLGDRDKAVAAEERFMKEFETKGLTGGEALKIAAQYSELIARNGNRFATSFARAAADAKKIGVNLQNVDKIGDNIIGNFEGFLESQAELGAMGFGFDTFKLAELAETGDTGALFNELRSQLSATGKDITKLRRSEQLALSEAFGISMEEIQRLAGKTTGSGEKTRTDLFESMNTGFAQLVNAMDFSSGILSAIAGLVTGILVLMKLNNPLTGTLLSTLTTVGGIMMGLTSLFAAFKFGKEKKVGGALASIAGGALGGFMVGGPWGAAIGGTLAAGSALYGLTQADDMISKPGYGERALVTPKGVVSLNNSDNIIAYADDMMATQAGIETMPKGELVKESAKQVQQINVDLSKLEAKLDKVTAAIANMGIYMDGNKVGKILVNNSDVNSIGVFRTQAKATL